VFIYTSLLYIIYITHFPQMNPKTVMWNEVVNEGIFLIICYHMVLFSNLIWDSSVKAAVGISLIVCLVSLLAGNTIFIAMISLRGAKVNKRAQFIKKKHESIMKERKEALDVLKSANTLNTTLFKRQNPEEYKANRLVFKHETEKIKSCNNEEVVRIITDKWGKPKKMNAK